MNEPSTTIAEQGAADLERMERILRKGIGTFYKGAMIALHIWNR